MAEGASKQHLPKTVSCPELTLNKKRESRTKELELIVPLSTSLDSVALMFCLSMMMLTNKSHNLFDSSILLKLSFFSLLPWCEARATQAAHENESPALLSLSWWLAAIIGSLALVFALLGAVIVRRHREMKEAPTAEEKVFIDGPRARVSTQVLVDGTTVDPINLKLIFAESGGKVPQNSDGTFTLVDGESYYLFRTQADYDKACAPALSSGAANIGGPAASAFAAASAGKRARTEIIQLESCRYAGSGLAASKDGLSLSLGYMGESVCFVPHGTVRQQLWQAALDLSDTDPRVLSLARKILSDLPCTEVIRSTAETLIHRAWVRTASTWLPRGDENWSHHEKDCVPGAELTLGPGVNEVGYTLRFRDVCLLVAQHKHSAISVYDALSQGALGGAAAALALLAAGVPVDDCVIPVVTHNGLTEQHGAVFLLKPSTPVYVALSPVLDLVATFTRLMAAKFRVAEAVFVQQLADQHLHSFDTITHPLAYQRGSLSLADYFFKLPKRFFGNEENATTVTALHELRVFQQLARMSVMDVVYPVARLIKHVDAQRPAWLTGAAMVYPNIALEGYTSGFISDPCWLEAVTAAINNVNHAGVVHIDLWPCNIMHKQQDDGSYLIKLVDFEASLAVDEPVPSSIVRAIARNGCRAMYHPNFLLPNAVANVDFDRWFLAVFAIFIERGLDPAIWTKHTELGEVFTAAREDLLQRVAAM
eukprot:m.217011 g.217011  ORF g.217011 m.217011 type:complete len:709 (-) comp15596_c1_seq3:126-2252(-)